MPARTPDNGADGMVLVRLSEIPVERREAVAWQVVLREGLVGVAALKMRLAAVDPRDDPALLVSARKARLALAPYKGAGPK